MEQRFEGYLKEKGFSPHTIKAYGGYVGLFLEWLEMDHGEAEPNDILRFVAHCREQGRSIKNTNLILTAIRHFYQMKGANNPAAGILVRGEKKTVPNDLLENGQLERLYQQYPAYDGRTKRNKVIVGLLVFQGLATGELEKLRLDHIDLKSGKLNVPESKQSHRKGGRKARTLNLKAVQVLELQEYVLVTRLQLLEDLKSGKRQQMATRKPNKIDWEQLEENLFFSLNGSVSLKPSLPFMIADLRKIEPKVRDAKQLRKSVIVNWLKELDIRQVQYMAGHGSISSTERYRAANVEELEEALKLHHPLG